jgi:membrane-associated protease RseP (regulator of RpoE activity)
MAYLLGVLIMLIGVAVSLALHELGHLVPAKRFGVRCTQFMIGLGPTVWSIRRGGTEYGIKPIPLGAYVRMLGMFPPKQGAPVGIDEAARADGEDGTARANGVDEAVGAAGPRRGRWSRMIDQAREDSIREIGPEDRDRLFYQRSVPQRLTIMLGGPMMNLLAATVLLAFTMMYFGLPETTTQVSRVSQCVLPVTAPADATCTADDPLAPAAEGGVLPGDEVVAFAGQEVSTWDEVRQAIRSHGGDTVTMTVLREGERVDLRVTPLVSERPALDGDGNPIIVDGQTQLVSVGFLGVSPSEDMVRQPITAVPPVLGEALVKVAGIVVRIPQKMVGVAKAAFGSEERDPNSPVSIVGVGRFAGEIGSIQGSEAMPISMSDRIASWLSLIASLNIALFVFNLIPLLPLDGGHVVGAVWESVRRGIAKLRRRPDPGPVDVARALPLAYGVATVLIAMSVLLIYADIVRPVTLGG